MMGKLEQTGEPNERGKDIRQNNYGNRRRPIGDGGCDFRCQTRFKVGQTDREKQYIGTEIAGYGKWAMQPDEHELQ